MNESAAKGVLCSDERVARDLAIQSQPILWAQAMLEQAEKVTQTPDARDAILARVGVVLYSRFAVTFSLEDIRRADQEWDVA